MIAKISKIKNFGLFQNYLPYPNLVPFKKINLIYGWNGSGKSTISRLFRCFELKEKHIDYSDAIFEIEDDDGNTYDHSFKKEPPIIKVFNTDFISKNINLIEAKTEPIIYLSEERIVEKEELEKIRKSETEIQIAYLSKNKEKDGINKNIDTFHKNAGKSIKDFLLGTIHADVTYNKSTSETIWENIKKTGTTLTDFIKSDDDLSIQKEFILLNSKKSRVLQNYKRIDIEYFESIQKRVESVAFKSIVNKAIERLRKEPRINSWAFIGLKLHKDLSSLKCEFCGQTLPKDKINLLEGHFNKEYEILQSELKDLRIQLTNLIIPEQNEIKLQLFDFLRNNYDILFSTLGSHRLEINNYIQSWIDLIDSKINNPFINEGQITTNKTITNMYNSLIDSLNDIIILHNKHVDEYDSLAEDARLIIENHFVAQKAFSEDLRKTEGELVTIERELSSLEKDLKLIRARIKVLETQMKNDTIAIDEINSNLSVFLGNDEIKLERIENGGYELQRNGEAARNISEGEKTAIALVYFIAKLKEQNNKIEDTVIVLDDPVSSFDSNHLFHANYFIKKECENAKQLFILTHNFYFFSLLKEWSFDKSIVEYYLIKSKIIKQIKQGTIENADDIFKYFSSEYHFLFSEISKYVKSTDKEYIETHVISNLCRQLLESFLTFKFGRKKLEKCFDEIEGFKEIDKVRKFVNVYSHRSNYGACINGFNDNLFAEVDTIVPLVLELIEYVDKVHYDSMVARLNGN